MHGLIFETSIWLLAGSTRDLAKIQRVKFFFVFLARSYVPTIHDDETNVSLSTSLDKTSSPRMRLIPVFGRQGNAGDDSDTTFQTISQLICKHYIPTFQTPSQLQLQIFTSAIINWKLHGEFRQLGRQTSSPVRHVILALGEQSKIHKARKFTLGDRQNVSA